jgi:formyltetrahydrofolate deformylase
MQNLTYTLLIDCQDQIGLVYRITNILFNNQLNIIRNSEFVEKETNHFFMRTEFSGELYEESVMKQLKAALPPDATIKMSSKVKKNIVILVTKEHHCLAELLCRYQFKELNANILAVIGNYNSLQKFTEKFDIPYHHITHEGKTRESHEAEIKQTIDNYKPDYLVLAKFMRILTPEFVADFPNRIINIHHSFLPAFIGANPYKQAYQRGVKIIGATAHFVNNDLDDGPIIKQAVHAVDHSQTPFDMAQTGRDVEKLVLANALRLVFEDCVFVSGNKTIILD